MERMLRWISKSVGGDMWINRCKIVGGNDSIHLWRANIHGEVIRNNKKI